MSMSELLLFTVVLLIISIILHEIAHGYAAYALGDPTAKNAGRLTLNPLPHIDIVGSVLIPAFLVLTSAGFLFGWAKPVPYNPLNLKNQRFGEGLVSIAGPAMNIGIAIIFSLVIRFGSGLPETFISLAALVVLINLFLGLFNLIPIPPLDGYTVLRSILPYRFAVSFRNFERKVQSLGILSLFLFIFVFISILSNPFFALVQQIFTLFTGTSLGSF
ncbi:site-2 protease family protein [Candidatus Wolfebacteria bacterium]|nr:site-2 protease family protein [Candidatus Wolfebacteria bacterium]